MFSPFSVRNKLEMTSEEKKYQWFMRFEIDENLEEHRQFRNTWEKLMDKIHSIVKDSLKKSYSISDPIYLLREKEEKSPGKLPSIYVKFDDRSNHSTKFLILD
jgi:5-bromo-4-chloroindolyl phosphate hydrolysis protein